MTSSATAGRDRRQSVWPLAVVLLVGVALLLGGYWFASRLDDDAPVAEEVLSSDSRAEVAVTLCPHLDTLARLVQPGADSVPSATEALEYARQRMSGLRCASVLASTTTTTPPASASLDGDGRAVVSVDTAHVSCENLRAVDVAARASYSALEAPVATDAEDQFILFVQRIERTIQERCS